MRGRDGMTLFLFSLIVFLGQHWQLAGLQAIPPDWLSAIAILGALGLSALLIALLGRIWGTLASAGDEGLPIPEATAATAVAPSAPDTSPPSPEEATDLDRLRDSGLVDASWYARTYPDVAAQDLDAADHYLLHGAAEGRNPNPFFDTRWYLDRNPDVREAGTNPLMHYLTDGAAEGRAAGPGFDTAYYQAENADVTSSGQNPLAHYMRDGCLEGRAGTAKR